MNELSRDVTVCLPKSEHQKGYLGKMSKDSCNILHCLVFGGNIALIFSNIYENIVRVSEFRSSSIYIEKRKEISGLKIFIT